MNYKKFSAVECFKKIDYYSFMINEILEDIEKIAREIADFKVLRATYDGNHCFIDIEDPKSNEPVVVNYIHIFNIYEKLYGNDCSKKMSLEDLKKGLEKVGHTDERKEFIYPTSTSFFIDTPVD